MKRSQEFKILATIDVGGAIVAVATLFAVLKILENFMSNANSMKATSVSGIIGIAVGMVLFASAIRILGAMDMLSCLQGVLALGIIMGELKYFLNGLEGVKAGSILSASVSMTVMGAAMLILTAAIAIIGALPLANVVQGLVVIGALMAVFALFAKAVSSINIGAILSASVAMAIMATAMIPLTAALAIISFLPNKLGSVTALLGTLAGVAAILALLGNFGGGALNMAAASTSILVVSAAILVLAGALVAISAINNPIATILTLLGALAVVFIALGVAALVLTPVMPAMLALAGVLVLVGVGCLAAGAGITLLSTGLIAFAAAIVANVDMIVTAFTMIVTGVGTVLLALGGVVVSVLSQLIPSLVEAGLQMIMALLSSFESHVGDIGMIALMIILNLVAVLTASVDLIIQAAIDLALALVNGLANGIRDNAEPIMAAVRNVLSSIIELVLTVLGELLGMIPGIGPKIEESLSGAKDVVQNFLAPETLGSGDELATAATDAVTAAGEAASEEATAQGQNIGAALTEGVGDSFNLSSLLGGDGSGISADSLLGDIDFTSLWH